MTKPIFLVLIVLSFPAFGQMSLCENLEPLSTPRPDYPTFEQAKDILPGTKYLHVFVQGFVRVQFSVQKSGKVTDATILESESVPTRPLKNISFDGFLDINVIPTVSEWLYKPVPEECRSEAIFHYELEENA